MIDIILFLEVGTDTAGRAILYDDTRRYEVASFSIIRVFLLLGESKILCEGEIIIRKHFFVTTFSKCKDTALTCSSKDLVEYGVPKVAFGYSLFLGLG